MRKELSPTHEAVACEVCGRTILKGERTERYVVPDGSRRVVCELCTRRAEGAGWIREALHSEAHTTVPRTEPRRSLFARFRRPRPENGSAESGAQPAEAENRHDARRRWRAEAVAPEPPEAEHDELELEEGLADPGHAQEPVPEPAHVAPPVDEGAYAGPHAGEPPPEPVEDELEEPEPALPEPEQELPEPEQELAPDELEPDPVELEAQREEEPDPDLEELAPGTEPRRPPTRRSLARDEQRRSRNPLRPRRQLRDPRHVRAIPTGAEARVERGLEIFNESEHRRTVAGLVRTLGPPFVTALPVPDSSSEVTVVVAWELSWYQYRVELGDTDEPVTLTRKGQEIEELDEELRRWNAAAERSGALAPGAPAR